VALGTEEGVGVELVTATPPRTVTCIGRDLDPEATTRKSEAPDCTDAGRTKLADDSKFGVTDIDVKSKDLAYVTFPVALFVICTSG
jgi:hypothetical protein